MLLTKKGEKRRSRKAKWQCQDSNPRRRSRWRTKKNPPRHTPSQFCSLFSFCAGHLVWPATSAQQGEHTLDNEKIARRGKLVWLQLEETFLVWTRNQPWKYSPCGRLSAAMARITGVSRAPHLTGTAPSSPPGMLQQKEREKHLC